MTELVPIEPDPATDLVLERVVEVSPAAVWRAWTDPEQLRQWFTPAPWTTRSVDLDVRPGGRFDTTMASPEGDEYPSSGCFLEVVEGRRLVFTSALGPSYRPVPVPEGEFHFTAVVELEPEGDGTRYRATAVHPDAAAKAQHEEMGFMDGWGAALDQMIALIKG